MKRTTQASFEKAKFNPALLEDICVGRLTPCLEMMLELQIPPRDLPPTFPAICVSCSSYSGRSTCGNPDIHRKPVVFVRATVDCHNRQFHKGSTN